MDAPPLNPQEKSGLLFDVQRSIRYHDRRVAHFDKLHKATNVFTILISGVVILDVFTPFTSPSLDVDGQSSALSLWVKIFAAIAALFSAFDLVVGFGHRANEHRDLKRKFCVLEREVISASTPESIQDAQIKRSEIEAEEPPIFRALDAMCYNEMIIAQGHSTTSEHFHKVTRFKRLTANWLRWSDFSSTVT
jgi:hypothetical protein